RQLKAQEKRPGRHASPGPTTERDREEEEDPSGLLLRQIGLGSSWGPAKRFSSAAGPHFAAGFTRPGRAAPRPSPLRPPASPPPHAPPRRCALPPAPARR